MDAAACHWKQGGRELVRRGVGQLERGATMDKIVHFEIPADDVARAKDFYGSIFEWGLDDMEGMDYTIVRTVDVDEQQMPKEPGAINGGMMKRSSDTPAPVITINVDSVDDALKKVEAGGGGK